MSGHLPECPWSEASTYRDCCCDRLRAVEQRVWRDARRVVDEMYTATLDVARDDLGARIEREQSEGDCDGLLVGLYYARECLDALRGES